MSNEVMAIDFGAVALPFDPTLAQQLVQDQVAGLAGEFKRAARLSMGNSGDWELVDENGEIHDMGREVNIVVVDQRRYNSRIHYAKSFDEQKELGEFEAPDCYSADGMTPDSSVAEPHASNCDDCPYNKISKNYEEGNLMCGVYRRIVAVLANADGTFSDPFVLEPKYKSLSGDKTVVKDRYGSWSWYMHTLAKQKVPVPVQAIVTTCMPMPKMATATMKFGVASNSAGGYWVLTKEQMEHILKLKDSDEVKELLEPFNAAFNNPSSVGQIPVKNIPADAPKQEAEEPKQEVEQPKPAPKPKAPAPKKSAPAPKPKTKKVVLGMDHPDVQNSEEYDYGELVEWAKDAEPEDVQAFLADNFPQALEPVEVPDETEVEEKPKAPAPKKSAPARKVKQEAEEPKQEAVVATDNEEVPPELAEKATALANQLDEFDD